MATSLACISTKGLLPKGKEVKLVANETLEANLTLPPFFMIHSAAPLQ